MSDNDQKTTLDLTITETKQWWWVTDRNHNVYGSSPFATKQEAQAWIDEEDDDEG